MTPEEAYEEALRRISEAEKTGALKLDLCGLIALNRIWPQLECLTSLQSLTLVGEFGDGLTPLAGLTDLTPLVGLTSLKELNILFFKRLSDLSPLGGLKNSLLAFELDLSPLGGLTSLQTLSLYGREQVSDLSPLAGLTSLQSLALIECEQLSDLSPLSGLASLQTLHLSGCLRIFALRRDGYSERVIDRSTAIRKGGLFERLYIVSPRKKKRHPKAIHLLR